MHFENVKYAQLKTWIRNKKGRRGGRRERDREERKNDIWIFLFDLGTRKKIALIL